MNKISIIIVAYKDGVTLENTLNSIYRFNDLGDELEIIVVDNSPESERIEQYIIKSDIDDYKYIISENKGFGYGNNRGAEIASGDILAFINPDVLLVEPIFKDIHKEFESNQKLMMLGCQILDKNGNKTFSYFYDYEDSIIKKFITRIYNHFNIFNQKTMFTSGCNMFIRKSAFEKSGCFDENIFMYNEEADIKRRIIKEQPDSRITFDKNHSIIHVGGSNEFSEKRFKLLKDSIIYFGKKYNLNYKKKLKYEYETNLFKSKIFSILNRSKKEELDKEINCFEKYYKDYIC